MPTLSTAQIALLSAELAQKLSSRLANQLILYLHVRELQAQQDPSLFSEEYNSVRWLILQPEPARLLKLPWRKNLFNLSTYFSPTAQGQMLDAEVFSRTLRRRGLKGFSLVWAEEEKCYWVCYQTPTFLNAELVEPASPPHGVRHFLLLQFYCSSIALRRPLANWTSMGPARLVALTTSVPRHSSA